MMRSKCLNVTPLQSCSRWQANALQLIPYRPKNWSDSTDAASCAQQAHLLNQNDFGNEKQNLISEVRLVDRMAATMPLQKTMRSVECTTKTLKEAKKIEKRSVLETSDQNSQVWVPAQKWEKF